MRGKGERMEEASMKHHKGVVIWEAYEVPPGEPLTLYEPRVTYPGQCEPIPTRQVLCRLMSVLNLPVGDTWSFDSLMVGGEEQLVHNSPIPFSAFRHDEAFFYVRTAKVTESIHLRVSHREPEPCVFSCTMSAKVIDT